MSTESALRSQGYLSVYISTVDLGLPLNNIGIHESFKKCLELRHPSNQEECPTKMQTILLVEDDRRLAAHWQDLLEDQNFRVIHETTTAGAIEVLDEIPIDLVLTDLILEDEQEDLANAGGLAVISYIALNVRPRPKIIATSGNTSKSTFVDQNFRKMNSLTALRKPVEDHQLLLAVRELLSQPEEQSPDNDDKLQRQLNESIQSNQAMLELLGAADGVWDWRIGTEEIVFAPGFRKLLGYSAEDLASFPDTLESLSSHIHPKDRESVLAAINLSLQNREPLFVEYRLRTLSGEFIWVRTRGSASFSESGEAIRFIASTHDISQERDAQKELYHAKESLDASPDAIFWCTEFGDIIYANDRACLERGYDQAELLNLAMSDLDTSLASKEIFHDVLWTEIQKSGRFFYQAIHRRKDSSVFPVEIAASIHEFEGQLIASIHVRDISESRQLEAEKRRLQFQLDQTLRSANIGIFDWDIAQDKILTSMTINRQLGYPFDKPWTFETFEELLHPADRQETVRNFKKLSLSANQSLEQNFRLKKFDDSYLWIFFKGNSETSEFGNVGRLSGAFIDISELIEERESLAKSNRDLEQFVYVASHDLQEPLRAISGFLQLLAHKSADQLDQQARRYIDNSVNGAIRMSQIINDLLYFSRVTRNDSAFVSVDLASTVKVACEELKSQIEQTKAEVRCEALPIINAVPTLMTQLFRNLIGNAIKYRSEATPEITVFCDHVVADDKQPDYRIRIRDNGIGIAPEYRHKIFDLFKRLHHRDDFPGTGIGLAICKRIVERHNGAIWVEEAAGQGSCFVVQLPANPESGAK